MERAGLVLRYGFTWEDGTFQPEAREEPSTRVRSGLKPSEQ